MIPNLNEELGYYYGVVSGNTLPELAEDIMQQGTNLRLARLEREAREALERIDLSDHEELDFVLSQSPFEFDQERIESLLQNGVDTIDEFVEAAVEDFAECGMDEVPYEWEDEESGTSYVLDYLGGAPIIFVVASQHLAWARPCSPCVPQAGDLDSPTGEDDGFPCLCPPPKAWDTEEGESAGSRPPVLKTIKEYERELAGGS